MASLMSSYLQEFDRLFPADRNQDSDLPSWYDQLALAAIKGDLRNCRFRSVCWRVFLGVLPKTRNLWYQTTNASRVDYEEKKRQVLEYSTAQNSQIIDAVIETPNNSQQNQQQNSASPWNRTMDDDQELRQTIDQDVVRTHPRVQFFNLPQIQRLMSDILFVFAKLHPHLQYRQGMHEILAPLIFVLRTDHQACDHVIEEPNYSANTFNPEIAFLVNGQFFEHDAFAMFCCIMKVVEPWYSSAQLMTGPRLPESNPQPSIETTDIEDGKFKRKPSAPNTAEREILARLQYIHAGLLKSIDPTLYQHLERLDVAPQLYGIRWVRLLFGREFTIQDLLVLWDAMFGHDGQLKLVDYVFVAMLIYVRDLLLHSDFSGCLHVVMRYPPTADVQYLVASALHFSDPSRFPRPPPSKVLPVMIQNNQMVGSGRTSSPMSTSQSNISPSATFAGDLFDQAGTFLSRGINNLQKRIEDVAGLDQPITQTKSGKEASVDRFDKPDSKNSDDISSSPSSTIKISRLIPDAIISGAKTPTASAAKFVDKFDRFLTGLQEDSTRSPQSKSQSQPMGRPTNLPKASDPPERPQPPRTVASNLPPVPSSTTGLDQSVLMNVCSRALADLDGALADLNMLRPVITDPRHAQVAADIAQRVTAARNSLQVISGRPLVASSSSSSRCSTPSAITP